MNPFYLDALGKRYGAHASDTPDAMGELVERYRQFKSKSLIDLAAVASSLAVDSIYEREPDSLALKAIKDTNPNFDPTQLSAYTEDELMGIVNSAKGKYFEYLVVDKLKQGEAVGDLVLPSEYSAKLAAKMNQPGWDILVDDKGNSIELLQLKATDSVDYIRDALQKYPDIKILATSEGASQLDQSSMVLDSGMSVKDIERTINTSLGSTDDSFLEQFSSSFDPLLPLIVIGTTHGYSVAVGRQTVADAVEVAKARVARAATSLGVGALVKALGGGWFSIPSALFAGWIFDRSQNIDDLIAATRKHIKLLAARRDYYKALADRSSA